MTTYRFTDPARTDILTNFAANSSLEQTFQVSLGPPGELGQPFRVALSIKTARHFTIQNGRGVDRVMWTLRISLDEEVATPM